MFEVTRLELIKVESARTLSESMKAAFGLTERLNKEYLMAFPRVHGTEFEDVTKKKFQSSMDAIKESAAK